MKDATLPQAIKVLTLIEQKETPRDQLQKLLGSGLLSDLLDANFTNGIDRSEFRRIIGLKPMNAFALTVNYDLSVKDAIAAGHYDWQNDSITAKNFPSNRKGTADLEIILVKFDDAMSSEDVLSELGKRGLRAAELPELLAFGEKYPDVQREFPVVALGSVWQRSGGDRNVLYLRGDADERDLYLSWFGDRWCSDDRFAAARK